MFNSSLLEYAPFSGEGKIEGMLIHEADRIDIEATVSVTGQFECSRCANPFSRRIETLLRLHFVPERLGKPDGDPDVHSYDPIGTSEINLLPDVRDALILAIPMKHLCHPDCRGICPICGKNRNHAPCNCTEKTEEFGPLAALKSLRERLRAEENPTGKH